MQIRKRRHCNCYSNICHVYFFFDPLLPVGSSPLGFSWFHTSITRYSSAGFEMDLLEQHVIFLVSSLIMWICAPYCTLECRCILYLRVQVYSLLCISMQYWILWRNAHILAHVFLIKKSTHISRLSSHLQSGCCDVVNTSLIKPSFFQSDRFFFCTSGFLRSWVCKIPTLQYQFFLSAEKLLFSKERLLSHTILKLNLASFLSWNLCSNYCTGQSNIRLRYLHAREDSVTCAGSGKQSYFHSHWITEQNFKQLLNHQYLTTSILLHATWIQTDFFLDLPPDANRFFIR